MCRFYALLASTAALIVLAQPLPVQAQALQGVITEIIKDANTPTGSITVVANNKATKFVVTEATKFEIVRGKERRVSNFLHEHRGEKAAVAIVPNSNPPTAAVVDILLPPAPTSPNYI